MEIEKATALPDMYGAAAPWTRTHVCAFKKAVTEYTLEAFFQTHPSCAASLRVLFAHPATSYDLYNHVPVHVIHYFSPLSFACLHGTENQVKLLLALGAPKSFPLSSMEERQYVDILPDPIVTDSNEDALRWLEQMKTHDEMMRATLEYVNRTMSPIEITVLTCDSTLMPLVWEPNVLPEYYFSLFLERKLPKQMKEYSLCNYSETQICRVYDALFTLEAERMKQMSWGPILIEFICNAQRGVYFPSESIFAMFLYRGFFCVKDFGLKLYAQLIGYYEVYYFYLYHLAVHPDFPKDEPLLFHPLVLTDVRLQDWFEYVYGSRYTELMRQFFWAEDRSVLEAYHLVTRQMMVLVSPKSVPRLGKSSSISHVKVPTDIFRCLMSFLVPSILSPVAEELMRYKKDIYQHRPYVSLYYRWNMNQLDRKPRPGDRTEEEIMGVDD